ncbi:MAG TPA: hypothetical protein VJT84_09445 [Gaiellaceae bacterium]|nr:hypothetical protein [Gaiellaceae bacterium]
MDELNHLGWVVYKSYEIAGYGIGIRTNSEACAQWLDVVLGAYEIDDEEEPYYSLWMPEQSSGPAKQYYVLYRESSDLLRTLDPAKIAQRLLSELESFALRSRRDAVFLEHCVVERNGARALVPSAIVPYMRLAGRRVERELTLPVDPNIGVARDGRLFAVPRQLDVPENAETELAERLGVRGVGTAASAVPEEVDLVCAFHYDPKSPPSIPITRAIAVHALAQSARNLRATHEMALPALAELVGGLPCHLLQEATPEGAFELLKQALEGAAIADAAATG